MKKSIISIICVIMVCASLLFTLAGCGNSKSTDGISLSYDIDYCDYSSDTDTTNVSIEITAYNENEDYAVLGFTYKIYFIDPYGSRLTTRTGRYDGTVVPDGYQYLTATYSGSNAISGEVARISVVPVSMELSGEEYSSGSDSSWGFWTWFWVIIAGILLLLFLFCCIGAEGDTDTIIGGVVIFLAPAVIILFVHFVFFF